MPPDRTFATSLETLRNHCIRVVGKSSGCGFPIAPGFLLTNAHVVGKSQQPGAEIEIIPWQAAGATATLRAIDTTEDLALLSTSLASQTFALSDEIALGDKLTGIGYPHRDGKYELDNFWGTYEGYAQRGEIKLLKLKDVQIPHGFSGGPLFNGRTAAIVGVTRYSRGTATDLGGWGVTMSAIVQFCAGAGLDISLQPNTPQPISPAEQMRRLQALLLSLPQWNNARSRTALLNRIFFGHNLLQHLQLDGLGKDVATEVAQRCLEYATPDEPKDSPPCVLLQGLADEFGATRHQTEIEALLNLFCRRPGSVTGTRP